MVSVFPERLSSYAGMTTEEIVDIRDNGDVDVRVQGTNGSSETVNVTGTVELFYPRFDEVIDSQIVGIEVPPGPFAKEDEIVTLNVRGTKSRSGNVSAFMADGESGTPTDKVFNEFDPSVLDIDASDIEFQGYNATAIDVNTIEVSFTLNVTLDVGGNVNLEVQSDGTVIDEPSIFVQRDDDTTLDNESATEVTMTLETDVPPGRERNKEICTNFKSITDRF